MYIYIYIYTYVQIWFLPLHQYHGAITVTKKETRSPKQDNECMHYTISHKIRLQSHNLGMRYTYKWVFCQVDKLWPPNEQSVKEIWNVSDASQKDIFGHTRWTFPRPSVTCAKRSRVSIPPEFMIGSTMQPIMNSMPQDRAGPNALCVLQGRNQICTYIHIWYDS